VYFVYISQGSAETYVRRSGIYNNHIIANCLKSVPVKECWNRSTISEYMDKSKVPRFYGPPCTWIRCVRPIYYILTSSKV